LFLPVVLDYAFVVPRLDVFGYTFHAEDLDTEGFAFRQRMLNLI
jgi:hypothetical protein